jgi:hypothetical protein
MHSVFIKNNGSVYVEGRAGGFFLRIVQNPLLNYLDRKWSFEH